MGKLTAIPWPILTTWGVGEYVQPNAILPSTNFVPQIIISHFAKRIKCLNGLLRHCHTEINMYIKNKNEAENKQLKIFLSMFHSLACYTGTTFFRLGFKAF